MLIFSKQAIAYDIMATENFVILQGIHLKFFEHVLWVKDDKITAGFVKILGSSFYIVSRIEGYFEPKSRNLKLHKNGKKYFSPKSCRR